MENKIINDLQVSSLGFGCWAMGGTWNNVNDNESIAAVHRAIDVGVNFFDTAPIYGKGHSEIILGKALKGIERDKVIVATKCGLPFAYSPELGRVKSRHDLSKESIFAEVDDSLSRLGTEYIDLYQLHWPDPNTPIVETGEALRELQRQGKIRNVGVSNFSIDMTRELMKVIDLATYQGLYNLIEQNPEHYHNIPLAYRARSEVLPFCAEFNLKYLPYSPLMQGLLTGTFSESNNFDSNDDRAANPKLSGEAFKDYLACANELSSFAKNVGVDLAHIAIQWLINQQQVGPVIAGVYDVNHVEQNARYASTKIDNDVLDEAERIVAGWKLT
ncbi:aldo/keto reductase [Vibrio renipiscarius]|uniref:Aldo/keto reductase n=1 Tax=Vibrio renipiscarius TaxID=1461322 RepID=A0A0C2NRD7_9VIBR|nr:aldo/keto reductase [Vibrio renipiscarius]KII75298.1 aldo/keto reductase [Vibrio renipiscarius]KII78750.1 aldo/keto reductase [Vibrio renipiscarius]